MKRDADVQSAVISGEPAKAGISDKNRTAAKVALNAIGELESVVSVGTNYPQYTAALQTSRIKYDAAIRELKPLDESEFAILRGLEEVFQCHIDAKDAWKEFIEKGDRYGSVDGQNYFLKVIAAKYDIDLPFGGDFTSKPMIGMIWGSCTKTFDEVAASLN